MWGMSVLRLLPISPPSSPIDASHWLSLSPAAFETWCADFLERHVYGAAQVTPKGPKGGDGGIDVVDHDAVGQCKRLRNRPARGLMATICELSGSMTRSAAPAASCSSRFRRRLLRNVKPNCSASR